MICHTPLETTFCTHDDLFTSFTVNQREGTGFLKIYRVIGGENYVCLAEVFTAVFETSNYTMKQCWLCVKGKLAQLCTKQTSEKFFLLLLISSLET